MGYYLLTLVIESATGQSHDLALRSRIFDPAGMAYTLYNEAEPLPPGLVSGYFDLYDNGLVYETTSYTFANYGLAGGIISNPYDLSLFIKGALSGSLLTAQSVTEMKTPNLRPVNPQFVNRSGFDTTQYGLGLFRWDTVLGTAYGHGGEAWGYNSRLFYFPTQDVTVALVVNASMGRVDTLIKNLVEALPGLIGEN